MTTAFPSQRLKIRFLPAVPGTNAAGAAAAAAFSAQIAQDAANTAVQATLTKVDKAGDTMSGALILSGDPTSANGAATKNYADGKVAKTGDSMTGFLSLNADPTATLHAATKNYADTKVALAGSTMTGLLTLSGAPINPLHAATKLYVDNAVVSGGGSVFQPLDADLTSIAAASLTGRMYFRRGNGDWAAVIVGAGLVFDPVTGDLASTAPPSGGNVSSSDTPTLNQLALWLGTTTIKGINIGTGLQLETVGPVQNLIATALPVTDGDKGDVTVSGSGATWTIDNNAVTYAKMQDVSGASVLLGRGSALGAGDPQEITLGAGLAMTGTSLAATGSISIAPTPTAGQTAKWVNGTTLKGANVYTTAATAPVTPDVGDFWYDTSTGTLAVNVDDGNTQQWLAVAPGAGNIASNSAFVTTRTFTTNGTYVPTPGTQFIVVEAVGGGAGGGQASGNTTFYISAGGGGSGGYSRSCLTAAQIGSSQTITIGAGGASQAVGLDTSFGALCIAKGGFAGGNSDTSAANLGVGGAGGVAGSGDVIAAGAPGGNGLYTTGSITAVEGGGEGGSSIFGGGGRGVVQNLTLQPGTAGSNYGSGGGGGTAAWAAGVAAGGAGSAGIVIVTEYNIGVGQQGPQGLAGGVTTPLTPQGRLTLQAGVPVMTASQPNKTTIFYSPYCGNQVPIFNGTAWATMSFNELSAVTSTSPAIGASKVNDWYVWSNNGVLTLSHGPDWASDAARAGTITRRNGIYTNDADITNGPAGFATASATRSNGTYVGTTKSSATNTIEFILGSSAPTGGIAYIGIWNCYNRVSLVTDCNDSSASWTHSSAVYAPLNGSSGNRLYFVSGIAEDSAEAQLHNVINNPSSAGNAPAIAIGLDSTSTFAALSTAPEQDCTGQQMVVAQATSNNLQGFHFFQALQYVRVGTGTYYGQINNAFILRWRY